MKKAYKISVFVLIVAILITSIFGYQNYQKYTKTRPINVNGILVNKELVACKSYEVTHSFLNGVIQRKRNFIDSKEIMQQITVKGNKLIIETDAEVTIKDTKFQKEIFKGTTEALKDFVFTKQGTYMVKAQRNYNDKYGKGIVHYEFLAEITESLEIHLSNEKPKQGELVKLEVLGTFPNSKVAVKGDFLPSHSFYNKDGIMELYIPITYYKPAQSYDMKLQVNDTIYPFTLDVQKEKFTQLHFTVSESVTNSTVNSDAANIEYKNKIHPLYKTMDSNKYWVNYFIKPIQETRISSAFGQERYVNNATTPTRHSGIDYAAPEGTEVVATNNGKVEFAEFVQLTGNTIVIDHGLGVKSYHFHLSSINVKAGDIVKQGQLIGKVGTTGFSTGPHLHFQMSIQNQPINPELMYQIKF
ncbi:M23 family metallopeptidase [Paludicola sp. MB14-C6]|uniref:M23 family metallopeptidase n=1 Tax=Paludihabitans sp. MB14-C6 TaxID=3070656 RepID=UPI0027DC682E|nr:M23 family metallopeptidase [Paludicola sp. MB14-C6]WMJ22358.1 M23 family metallopeptidase [Paludicola sp. MB14-C6]